jgi:CRP-like cAMP-binding protein
MTQGEPAKRFYIVMKGAADAMVRTRSGGANAVSELVRGQYFGETGILSNGASIATIKAGVGGEAGLISIDKETFAELLTRSEATRREIQKISGERVMRCAAAGEREACQV